MIMATVTKMFQGTEPSRLHAALEGARRLEPDAFHTIVDEYAPRLRGLLRRIVRGVEVDDMVQEVFLRVVRTIDRYEESGRFDAWIFQIARNVAHDHLRESQLRLAGARSMRLPEKVEAGTGDCKEEKSVLIEEALGQLPDAEREVILLRHFGRLTFEEIASVMGTPLGTALARSHRGLAKLRQWVEEQHE